MPRMLRHTVTGEIWPYNPDLARHDDVETYDEPDPQFAEAIEGRTVGDLAAKAAVEEKTPPRPVPTKKKAAPKKTTKSAVAAAEPEPTPEPEEEDDPLEGLDLPEDV